MKTIKITYKQYLDDIQKLIKKIKKDHAKDPFQSIIAISRAGLMPAQIIAYALDIRQVFSFGLASYDSANLHKDIVCYQPIHNKFMDAKVLIVDELADSGRTLAYALDDLITKGICSTSRIATVYNKNTKFKGLSYYVKMYPADSWIKFFYEK